jgi:hypothetical protein
MSIINQALGSMFPFDLSAIKTMHHADKIKKITSLPEYYRSYYKHYDTFTYYTTVKCSIVNVNPDHFEGGILSEVYRQVREYEDQKREIKYMHRTALGTFVGNAFRGMKESEYREYLNERRKGEKRKVDIERVNTVSGITVLFLCVALLILGFCVPKQMPSLVMWYLFILIAWAGPQEYEYENWSLRQFIFYRSCVIILCLIAIYSFIHRLI